MKSTPGRLLILVISLVMALAAGATAAQTGSAAVTLGSALETEPGTHDQCSTMESDRGCFAVNTVLPGRNLVAPFDGVIVRWRTRLGSGTDAQTIRIRVVRTVTPEEFEYVSSGTFESIPEGADTYTFAASLPIAAGEGVGLEADSGKEITYQAISPLAESLVFNPTHQPLDGLTTDPPIFTNPGLEATFNVEVEPDCDHDGLGDETQDSELPPGCKPSAPAVPSNAFTLGKPKLNRKKGIAKVPVTVPGPGAITMTGKGVVKQTKTPTAAGTVNMPVRSMGKRKRKLSENGKVKVKIAITYTPTGGAASSQNKGLLLRKSVP